jgi:glucokinase
MTLEHVREAFQAGDSLASEIVLEAGRAVGIAAACLIVTLNIHKILLAGSVPRFGKCWLDAVKDEAGKRALAALVQKVEIGFGEVEEDAVILGASALLLTQELGLSLAR